MNVPNGMASGPGRKRRRGLGWGGVHLIGAVVLTLLAFAKALAHAPNEEVFPLVFLAMLWGIPASIIVGARLLAAFLQADDED